MKIIKILALLITSGFFVTSVLANDYVKIAKTIAKNAPALGKNKIAVIPFSAVDGRQSVGGRVIAERLNTAIVETKKFNVVERSLIDKLLTEQKLALTGVISDDSAQKIGRLSGAGAILAGTMTDLKGGRIEVNARLVETETGKVFSSARGVLERDWIEITPHPDQSYTPSSWQSEDATPFQKGKWGEDISFRENEEGLRLLRQNKFDDAILRFTKALEDNPALGTVYNNRGAAYFKKGDYKKAIQDFSLAIEHEPSNALAFNNRGAIALNLNELDRALQNFEKAIELSPDYADAYTNRGDLFFRKGMLEKALENYTKALSMDTDHLQARANRGAIYLKQGQLDNAHLDYSKAIEINPDAVEPYINRGFVNFDLKKYDEAVKDFSSAIRKDSKAKEAYAGLGLVYLKQGKKDLALNSYKKAVALDARYKGNIIALTQEGHFYTPNQIAAFREMELAFK